MTTLQEKSSRSAHTDTRPHSRRLYVLIACEESQAECRAFRDLGHIAYSCDLQPCRPYGHPEWHIQADCIPLIKGATKFVTQVGEHVTVPSWDLIICHPPCTYLCRVSGVQLIRRTDEGTFINKERYQKMIEAARFFRKCLRAKAPFVAVENPIPMKRAGLPKPSFYACPSWYGVKYTKKTLYWVKNLPPLVATCDYPNPKSFVSSSRGKYRSRTFPELAQALARQWSEFILDEYEIQAHHQEQIVP